MSIEDRLLRYYRWKMAGDVDEPSPEVSGGRDGSHAYEMPAWFARMCDVGRALSRLPAIQERAVEERHRLKLALEDAMRVEMIYSMRLHRTNEVRGLGSRREADDEIEAIRKTLRVIENSHAYREGMAGLFRGGLR